MTPIERIKALAEKRATARCEAIYGAPAGGSYHETDLRGHFLAGATDVVLIKAIQLQERAQVAKDAWSLSPSEFFWEMHEEALAELKNLLIDAGV